MLIDLLHRIKNRRAIRAEAVSLYLEHQDDALAVASRFATDRTASDQQRWFYRQVSRAVERLIANMRGLDTATRYLEHGRLEAEYLTYSARARTETVRRNPRLLTQSNGSAVE